MSHDLELLRSRVSSEPVLASVETVGPLVADAQALIEGELRPRASVEGARDAFGVLIEELIVRAFVIRAAINPLRPGGPYPLRERNVSENDGGLACSAGKRLGVGQLEL